ncbi:hypothetical protein NPX13_g7107 [Xylaria arbuscula]|uniref:Uncharacterized protein n=1 Tax=Xylaria arbuscula TaxID=114810 RepID=A0A9W8NBK5_9PEZI|nr:hypothetical protein NPX13_g7107 [Xylaria arbuscula]
MDLPKNIQDPKVSFCDDGGRPKINQYSTEPQFRPNDQVYIRAVGTTPKEGPFIVASVNDAKYTLCDGSGKAIQNGKMFEEKDIEPKDPFE